MVSRCGASRKCGDLSGLSYRLRGGLVVVKQIPKSPSGKILRRLLKDVKDGQEFQLYTLKAKL